MRKTPAELDALQRLPDRSRARATGHLRGIINDRQALSAADISSLLTGMEVAAAATVTARGEPRLSAVDGHILTYAAHRRIVVAGALNAAGHTGLDEDPVLWGLGHRLTGPNAMTSQPRLLTVNIVHRIHPGYFHDTAIDKQPVDGPVELTATGLAGDRQLGPHHGGSDKAVYAYATEDAHWWTTQLGRTIPPGLFGENLRTHGLDVSGAIIGEKWRIGKALLEVRMPRTPCQNLSMRIGIDNFHIRFNTTGRVGAMLKVREPGLVCAGDPITVVDRPHHGVRVCDLATGPDATGMRRLLDSGIPLATTVRAKAHRIVRRSAPANPPSTRPRPRRTNPDLPPHERTTWGINRHLLVAWRLDRSGRLTGWMRSRTAANHG